MTEASTMVRPTGGAICAFEDCDEVCEGGPKVMEKAESWKVGLLLVVAEDCAGLRSGMADGVVAGVFDAAALLAAGAAVVAEAVLVAAA